MAKYLDDNGLLYFWQKIKTVFATQSALDDLSDTVDGLVSEGGEPNVIETVKVNGSALTPDANKAVNVTVAQGSANGTVKVNGSDVAVKGLGSAAYTESSAFEAAGAVSTAIADLDSSISAESNKAIASVTITDGKITGSTKVSIPTVPSSLKNPNAVTIQGGSQTVSTYDGSAAKTFNFKASSTDGAFEITDGTTTKTVQLAGEFTDTITTATTSGSGNAVTAITASNGALTVTKGTTFLTSHQDISGKANLASPTFTGTPKAPTAAAGTKTTQIATTEFVDTAVTNAIAGVTGISYEIVTTLPSTGSAGVIYLIAHSHGTGDVYDEYIWTGSAFEKIGNTDIDLSGYWSTSDLVAITNAEIDTILAA